MAHRDFFQCLLTIDPQNSCDVIFLIQKLSEGKPPSRAIANKDNCVPEIVDGEEIVKYQAMVEGTMHPSTKMAIKRLTKLHSLDNYYDKLKGKTLESNEVTGAAELLL